MKYLLVTIFVLAIIGGGVTYWWLQRSSTSHAQANTETILPAFTWGVGINPTPTGIITRETVLRVVEEAETLGVNTIRLRYPHEDPAAVTNIDWLADIIRERNYSLRVVLVFDQNPNIERIAEPNSYQDTFMLAKDVATKYRGVFQYYQLGNEMAAYALKPNWGGHTTDSYIPERYEEALRWLKGLSDGIAVADPTARRVVTGNWLNVVFWEQAKQDGLKFEIVGWDWFHEKFPIPDLTNMTVDGQPYDLIGKLAALGDVWITEAGVNGSVVGYDQAANYLEQLVRQLYSNPFIKGFFLPTLTDEVHRANTPNWQHAPVGLIYENGEWRIGLRRIVFDRYRQLIQDARSGKLIEPTALTLPVV